MTTVRPKIRIPWLIRWNYKTLKIIGPETVLYITFLQISLILKIFGCPCSKRFPCDLVLADRYKQIVYSIILSINIFNGNALIARHPTSWMWFKQALNHLLAFMSFRCSHLQASCDVYHAECRCCYFQLMLWFVETCEAVKYLHGRGVVHRDIKPQNIFLTKDNSVRLGDFGVSAVIQQ